MSKIIKSNGKQVRGFKMAAANEDKDTNEDDDDIQNIDNLDLQKKKKNQQSRKQSSSSSSKALVVNQSSKVFAQDVSLMDEELEDEQVHPNQARRHTFKSKINRNKSSSSEREEFMKTSSDSQSKLQNNNQQQLGFPKKSNLHNASSNRASNKNITKGTPNAKENPKVQENPKVYTIVDNKPSKKLKKEQFRENMDSEQSIAGQSDGEKDNEYLGKSKLVNNKENVKNGNQESKNQKSSKMSGNNKMAGGHSKGNGIVRLSELFPNEEIPVSKETQKDKKQDSVNKQKRMQQEKIIVNVDECPEEKEDDEVEGEEQFKGYSSFSEKQKSSIKNKFNNSYQSQSSQSDLSMQAQGANSSQFDSKSMSMSNLQGFGEDDSIICNYSNMLDYDLEQNGNSVFNPNQNSNNNQEDEESEDIQIKKKPSTKKTEQDLSNFHKSVISSDNCLSMHTKESETKQSKVTKPSTFSKSKSGNPKSTSNESNLNNSFHPASASQLGSNNNSSNKKKDIKDLKSQMLSDFGSKQNMLQYRNDSLQDISGIEEEIFEINELPKDKTRVLWIFNSVHFIERLTNNGHFLEGQEIVTQNGKKWSLQISYSEKQQQIECVFSRQNKDDTSKQQLYYVFKFYALSKTENIIDKSYNGNKTYSPESISQSFTFPLDIELILEKYQHIIFELTLTPIRLQHYNSKEETNYVGLLNEGQTCYMNSYLQTLFHIKAFVKLVYSIPTEQELESVFPHSLQVLFYQLQSRGYHCTTTELLKSFSWDRSKARIQQDVQEFSCLFIEYLESKAEKIPQLKGRLNI